MTPSKRRPTDRWEFVQSDDALWCWRFLDNLFTPPVVTSSRHRYLRLHDCVANAKRHGYDGWPTAWQALRGGIFFHSSLQDDGAIRKVRSRSRQ
jgi:hypothetical protein